MLNNTFRIVFREGDWRNIRPNPNQDRYGWEHADDIEYTDYQEAKAMMQEYRNAMPNFIVLIRATPIVNSSTVCLP